MLRTSIVPVIAVYTTCFGMQCVKHDGILSLNYSMLGSDLTKPFGVFLLYAYLQAWRGPGGGRGFPSRGGPRGGPGPRGGGFKRPNDGGPGMGNKRPRNDGPQSWSQPIAQQPLGGQEFYRDSW